MSEMETVWSGSTWRSFPPPVVADPTPVKVYTRKPKEEITPGRAEVLAVIRAAGKITRRAIIEALPHRTYAAVSTAVDRLESECRVEKLWKVRVGKSMVWLYRVREGL